MSSESHASSELSHRHSLSLSRFLLTHPHPFLVTTTLCQSLSVFERIVKALSRITDKIIGFCRVLVHLILSSPVTQVQITQSFLPTWVDRATIGAGLGCVVERSVILCPPSLHRLHNTLHHLGLPLLLRNV